LIEAGWEGDGRLEVTCRAAVAERTFTTRLPAQEEPSTPTKHRPLPSISQLPLTMLSRRIAAYAASRSAVRPSPMAVRGFVRTYAQAAEGASTKPPIALYGIDGTYATALVSQLSGWETAMRPTTPSQHAHGARDMPANLCRSTRPPRSRPPSTRPRAPSTPSAR
jgi:hypothetical protein